MAFGLALASMLALCWSSEAQAGNPDRLYMSSDAALTAGAITADTSDTGSVWYNPAGLARSSPLRFDINVSGYALQLGGAPKLEGVGEGVQTETISVLNFAAVPTAFASVATLGRFHFALGVFVPQMGVSGLRARVTRPLTDDQVGFEFDLNDYRTTQEMYGGPAFGVRVAPNVDVGVSLLVHYRAILQTEQARVLVRSSETEITLGAGENLTDWLQLGLAPSLGVQLQLSKRMRYGMLFRLPSIRLLQLLGYSETTTYVLGGETTVEAEFTDKAAIEGRVLTPGRMNGGLSYQADRFRVALEGSYQFPFRNAEVEESLRPTLNRRLGARFIVQPNLQIGGGIFTNMSTQKSLQNLGDSKVNFYGLTLAAQVGTPYEIAQRDGKKLDPPGKLRFASCFAFTYAIGLGQTLYGQAGTLDGSLELYREIPYRVTAHEWVLSIGSSLFEN